MSEKNKSETQIFSNFIICVSHFLYFCKKIHGLAIYGTILAMY